MRNIAILLVILLFAAVAYYVYDNLRERTFAEKAGDIIRFEDRRELTDQLQEYLASEDPDIRARAALAVGRIGSHNSGKLLFDLITSDSSMDVVAQAAFAIGLSREKHYAVRLLDLALDQPSKIAMRLVEAAGRLTDTTMTGEIDMLAGFLTHPSPEIREAACMALYRAGARDRGQQLIDLSATEPDEDVQIAALYALARLGVAEAAEVYTRHFADADPFVRSLAVRGLAASDTREAVRYLTIALNDKDAGVVAQAVAGLANKSDPESRLKLAGRLGLESDEKLTVAIIDALARQENSDGLDALNTVLSSNPSPNIVAAAVKYSATVKKDRAIIQIDSLQTLDNPQILASCAEAYTIIGTQNIIPRLAVLFNDPHPLVRVTAFNGLVSVDSSNIDFYLAKALDDSCYVLPVVAIDQIKTGHLIAHLPRLKEMMSLGDETHEEVRGALVACAGSFIGAAEKDTNAMQILIDGIFDSDYIVRRMAADIYEEKLGDDYSGRVPPAQTRLSWSQVVGAVEKYVFNPYATIVTNRGEIELELYFDVAPLTVLNFVDLSEDGFYDEQVFHRVIPNFVIQGGDPEGHGWGGPGYTIRCEYSSEPYRRGTVGIATSGKDTGGSQFFITLSPQPHLEGRYTVFGQVLAGMDVVDQIVKGDTISHILIHEDENK